MLCGAFGAPANQSLKRRQFSRRGYFLLKRTQRVTLGHREESFSEKRILITSVRRLSIARVQLTLARPSGQVARCCSQSIRKCSAEKPVCSVGVQLIHPGRG
jgi:hypothetical protein